MESALRRHQPETVQVEVEGEPLLAPAAEVLALCLADKRKEKLRTAIGCPPLALLILYVVYRIVSLPGTPEAKIADAFVTAIGSGNHDAAHALLSPRQQRELTPDALKDVTGAVACRLK